MPVVGVRVGDDPSTSGVPLVDQPGDGVQTFCTLHVGAADAGASDRTGQVGIGQVGRSQVGIAQIGTVQSGTGQVGIEQVGICLLYTSDAADE